jgi:hypothetical protein
VIYGGDRVHQHLAIWTRIGGEVRCASGSGLERRIEDVCDVRQLCEFAFRIFGIKQIDGDVTVAWTVCRLPSRQPHHSPIGLLNEPLDKVASNNPERTDNDRLILHAVPDWQLVPSVQHSDGRRRPNGGSTTAKVYS